MTVSQANTLMHCQTFCRSLLSMKIWNDYLKDLGTDLSLIPLHSRVCQKLSLTGKNTHKMATIFSAPWKDSLQTSLSHSDPKTNWKQNDWQWEIQLRSQTPKIDLVKPIYTGMKCFELIFYWKTINYNECCHWTRLTLWKYACRKTNTPANNSTEHAGSPNIFTYGSFSMYSIHKKSSQEINAQAHIA